MDTLTLGTSEGADMQRIVVAAKAGAQELWLADAAAELAQQTGAGVTVVSFDGVDMEALSPLPRSEYADQARDSAELVARRLADDGAAADVQVRSGRPVPGVLIAAEELDADLIVVGASTRGRVAKRLLGDTALELVQRSKRPVLVVSPPS
jgi:nucleotide-binding universal stress UspA family protein